MCTATGLSMLVVSSFLRDTLSQRYSLHGLQQVGTTGFRACFPQDVSKREVYVENSCLSQEYRDIMLLYIQGRLNLQKRITMRVKY